ncbi:MAG: MMPL family transporter [Myxococcales bacterium]|nr:MMPL family transporter [Myxococcales bacterium]
MRRDLLIATTGGLLVVLVAIMSLWSLPVVVDMSQFMLGDRPSTEVMVARALAHSPASRTLIILAEGIDGVSTHLVSQAIEHELRADPTVMRSLEYISGSPPQKLEETLWLLYGPRVPYFLARSAEEARRLISPSGVSRALDKLLTGLQGPQSSLIARVAPRDPWLILPKRFEQAASAQGGIQVINGRFRTSNGRFAVVFLRTRASAFDGAKHAQLLDAIDDARERVSQKLGLKQLQISGFHRFAVAIQSSMQRDITRISILSIVSLLIVFIFLFRSLRVLASVLIVVSSGFICGLATTRLLFGEVHGLTLAFGSSLIGVSIDYALHYYVHFVLRAKSVDPGELMRKLWPGLLLGAGTTVIGFMALAVSSIPGLFEVSIFAATGIVGACVSTRVFLPVLVPVHVHQATALRSAKGVDTIMGMMVRFSARRTGRAFVGLLGLMAVSGWFWVKWDDDITRLARMPTSLISEEEMVGAHTGGFEQRRCIVALGTNAEEALQVNDRLLAELDAAVHAGELMRFRSIGTWLSSTQTQHQIAGLLQADVNLPTKLRELGSDKGFSPGAFDPFIATLSSPLRPALTLELLYESPLKSWIQNFIIDPQLGPKATLGMVSFLGGVVDSEALSHRIRDIPGAIWLDQANLYNEANRKYQQRTVIGLLLGLVGVSVLVWGRYRKKRELITALLPATIAVMVVVGCLGWLGVELNLVALTGLLMVFSMGVDYGVFLAESGAERLATQLAIVVAWGSTVAGFGFLSLSSHPAMQSLGLVAGLGVTVTVVTIPYFCPRVGVWR